MKFENTKVYNFEGAFRGMRNPMNSWDKSDSFLEPIDAGKGFVIGENDMALAQRLIRAGSEHRKFMRQIFVCVDITAPLYWYKEFDTYKVATVRNSCSTMHKIHVKEFVPSDFTHDAIDEFDVSRECFNHTLDTLNWLRNKFNSTSAETETNARLKKKLWRGMIQLLPDGFNMRSTCTFNYENLLGMCSKGQRRHHKLNEWSGIDELDDENFIEWARTLPYAQELIFIDELSIKE